MLLSALLNLPSIANVFLFGSVLSVCSSGTETCGFLKLCFIPSSNRYHGYLRGDSVQHTTTETVTKMPCALFRAHRINFSFLSVVYGSMA